MSVRTAIGAARRRMVLAAPTMPAGDGAGGGAPEFTAVAEIWAALRWLAGEERSRGDRPEQAARWEITLRWRSGVTAGMRLVDGGRAFAILSVSDRDGRHRRLTCLCEEVGP